MASGYIGLIDPPANGAQAAPPLTDEDRRLRTKKQREEYEQAAREAESARQTIRELLDQKLRSP
jgi:hypothetical protein